MRDPAANGNLEWAREIGGSVIGEPEPIGFWVTRSDEAAGPVIALHGELDVAAAPQLEKLLDGIHREGHRHVTVDLSDLSFVDSAGVSVLIKAKKEADEDGAAFVLRRPTAQVHRVFALVGMVDWLAFEER
jgi:anti-anti-sigma factor